MALATQCPFCQTTFKVANDQLKLRDGLVRCGHCQEVFDGNAHLLPGQPAGDNHNWPAAPISITPSITPAMARANAAAPNYGAPPIGSLPDADAMAEIEAAWDLPPASPDIAEPDEDDRAHEAAADTLMIEADEVPVVWRTPGQTHDSDDLDARDDFDAVLLPMHQSSPPRDEPSAMHDQGEDEDDRRTTRFHTNTAFDSTALDEQVDDTNDPDNAAEQPEFMLAAQRRQRRARLRRILMIVVSVILVFTGLGQGIYLERNRIAIAAPHLKPLLIATCQPLRCTVGLQRQIDQLSIESNELQAATPDHPALTLSLLLRNHADTALAWPHIELTLNDDDEKAVIRRVFAPAEYLPAGQTVDAGMAADSEQAVKLSFTLAQAIASGYRVYLFYP